jgi:hypothetical protein
MGIYLGQQFFFQEFLAGSYVFFNFLSIGVRLGLFGFMSSFISFKLASTLAWLVLISVSRHPSFVPFP